MQRRSASPFCQPITPRGVSSAELNPNWATRELGCRVVDASGNWTSRCEEDADTDLDKGESTTAAAAAGLLHDDGEEWFVRGDYPHYLLLRLPVHHSEIRFVGLEAPRHDPASAPTVATFYSGPTPDPATHTKHIKCQTLPGRGVQIWDMQRSPIPSTHNFIKIIFNKEQCEGAEAIALSRLYLFSQEPHLPPQHTRSPSPEQERTNRQRHRLARTGRPASPGGGNTEKLAAVLEVLDADVRKLHRMRQSSPARQHSGSGLFDSVSHPSAPRAGLRETHRGVGSTPPTSPGPSAPGGGVGADPVWMTVFRSYDDRLARCENQVQRILALLEVREERERFRPVPRPDNANDTSRMSALNITADPNDFPSAEMHNLIINWVKPALQRWAKTVEKKITRTLNNKIDESFERITRSSVDKRVKELMAELQLVKSTTASPESMIHDVSAQGAAPVLHVPCLKTVWTKKEPQQSDTSGVSSSIKRKAFHLPSAGPVPTLQDILSKNSDLESDPASPSTGMKIPAPPPQRLADLSPRSTTNTGICVPSTSRSQRTGPAGRNDSALTSLSINSSTAAHLVSTKLSYPSIHSTSPDTSFGIDGSGVIARKELR